MVMISIEIIKLIEKTILFGIEIYLMLEILKTIKFLKIKK